MLKKLINTTALVLSFTILVTGCTKATKESIGGVDAPVTIVYGGWANKILMHELADKFNAANPHIIVEIIDDTEWLGNENLTKRAATNNMPDIIAIENPTIPIQNNWLLDLKPYLDADAEMKISQNLLEYGTFNDKILYVPSDIFISGILLNKDLLSSYNIPIPNYDWTMDEYVDILKNSTRNGTIGVNTVNDIIKHYPAQMNPDLGWASYNEKTNLFQLDQDWISTMDMVRDLYDSKVSVYETLEQIGNLRKLEADSDAHAELTSVREAYLLDNFNETDSAHIWFRGKSATWFEFTWSMNLVGNPNYSGFEYDFYPIPVKNKGDEARPGIIVDSLGITASSKHPKEAFEFLKYITYSVEGFNDKVDIIENYDESVRAKYTQFPENLFQEPLILTSIPPIDDATVTDTWIRVNNAKPGLKYVIERMDTAYVDGLKVTPGYIEAFNELIEQAILNDILPGSKRAVDMASELENRANEISTAARESLLQ
jgi:multiple sugar transport system substrate-binding protein